MGSRVFPGSGWGSGGPERVLLLSPFELNNFVFALLKYTWDVDEPPNDGIAAILGLLGDAPLFHEATGAVAAYVQQTTGRVCPPEELELRSKHAQFVLAEFMKLSPALRNDLGKDAGAFEADGSHAGGKQP